MVTSESLFLFLCLPVALLLYYLMPARYRTARNVVLFLEGLVIYAYAEPVGALILLAAIAAGYAFAKTIARYDRQGHYHAAGRILFYAVCLYLAVFLLLCYLPALLQRTGALSEDSMPVRSIFYPLGMAFWLLQILSFLTEIANGAELKGGFLNFALSVSLFPKLVRGPVMIYKDISDQVADRKESLSLFGEGSSRFIAGLGKAVILGGTAGSIWKSVLSHLKAGVPAAAAWIGLVCLSFFVYFAVSGFMDMAEGLGMMFGFQFPASFRYPFISKSVSEFTKRWDMTVTDFFRSSFVAPKGSGTRSSRLRGVFFAALFFGIWQKAGLNALIFGIYAGAVLVFEKTVFYRVLRILPAAIRRLITFLAVSVGWLILFSPDLKSAVSYFAAMFGGGGAFVGGMSSYYFRWGILPVLIMILASTPLLKRWKNRILSNGGRQGRIVLGVGYALVFVLAVSFVLFSPGMTFPYPGR